MARETNRGARRSPVTDGHRSRLNVKGKDPNYEYRIVNDVDDNISIREEQGWEVVTDAEVKIGDKRVADPTDTGSPKTVSVGGGLTGYLMRIKKEWYQEDQAAKQAQVDKVEQATKPSNRDGFYGKVSFESKVS